MIPKIFLKLNIAKIWNIIIIFEEILTLLAKLEEYYLFTWKSVETSFKRRFESISTNFSLKELRLNSNLTQNFPRKYGRWRNNFVFLHKTTWINVRDISWSGETWKAGGQPDKTNFPDHFANKED